MAQATAENWKDSICGQCGASIVEPRDGDQRRACPKCGSLTCRIVVEQPVQLESLETVTATAAVHIEIASKYPRLLLNIARTLIGENRCALSIIVAHMACEVATEESLSRAFASKGIKYLQDSVTDLLNGYNLANDRIRRLYTALTGDALQNAPFWQSFKESSSRRNNIIHGGTIIVQQSDAENSYKAANELLAHLGYH